MAEIISKFTIIKDEDVEKYLTKTEKHIFLALKCKISENRKTDGKKENMYMVCNMDEPYAGQVLDIILKGEDIKEKSQCANIG